MINGYARATNEIIPAVRSIIAKELNARYHMKEQDIAKYLGVAQAAVSKYLNGEYSKKIKEIEAKIDRSAIEAYITKMVEGKKEYANACICMICNKENAFDCKFSQAMPGIQ